MNREDCEKLLDACINAWVIHRQAELESFDAQLAQEIAEDLRGIVVGIMADEKKPVYRDGGITVKEVPLPYTVPTDFPKPIVTCDGRGRITAAPATWDNSEED